MPRYVALGLGLVCILAAIFLPIDWYDQLPKSRENLPLPPIKGVTLVRLCFGLEGIALMVIALRGGLRLEVRQEDCLEPVRPFTGPGRDLRHPAVWVAAATLLAAALRLYRLNSDLWIDEITPVFDYLKLPPLQIIAAYT